MNTATATPKDACETREFNSYYAGFHLADKHIAAGRYDEKFTRSDLEDGSIAPAAGKYFPAGAQYDTTSFMNGYMTCYRCHCRAIYNSSNAS